MVRQDFRGRENSVKMRDRVSGVKRRHHEMQKDQDGKYIDEVNKPCGSTLINRNGLI